MEFGNRPFFWAHVHFIFTSKGLTPKMAGSNPHGNPFNLTSLPLLHRRCPKAGAKADLALAPARFPSNQIQA